MATDVIQDEQQDRRQLHQLVDRLAPAQVHAVRGLLEAIVANRISDPVAHAIANAPADDEPVTDEDRRRIREGEDWLAQRGGKGIPMEEILADFGLKPEDFQVSSENNR